MGYNPERNYEFNSSTFFFFWILESFYFLKFCEIAFVLYKSAKYVCLILGSGWGVRMSPLEKSYVDSAFSVGVKDPLFWAPRDAYGPDQGFLKR